MPIASLTDIAKWFDEGVKKEATHMIVVTDSFDYEDFPVYVTTEQDAREVADEYKSKPMTIVTEVYNLSLPKGEQMRKTRVMNF